MWEPAPPGDPAHSSRRRDRSGGHSGRGVGRKRRRSLIVGGVVAVALGVTGYTELSGKGPTFTKGAATTILPAASQPSDGQSASSSLGTGISLTNPKGPSKSASPTRSASASATPTKSANANPNGKAPPSPSGGGPIQSPSVSADPTTGGPTTYPSPSPSPTPSPSKSPITCFLFICN